MTVHVKSGQEFVGILHACRPDHELSVVLSQAREKLGPDELMKNPEERMVILSKDFVQLVAHDVDLYDEESVDGAVKNQGERSQGPSPLFRIPCPVTHEADTYMGDNCNMPR